jgi:hypothetical protein
MTILCFMFFLINSFKVALLLFRNKKVSDGTISRQIHVTYKVNSATYKLNGNLLTASKKCHRCSSLGVVSWQYVSVEEALAGKFKNSKDFNVGL